MPARKNTRLPRKVKVHETQPIPVSKIGGKVTTVRTVSGVIEAHLIMPNGFKIADYRFGRSHQTSGYQRMPDKNRIHQLVNAMREDNVGLPTSVLLNIRPNARLDEYCTKEGKQGVLDIQRMRAEGVKFYVVDGQHRLYALKKLIDESEGEEKEKFLNYRIPFVCMLGAKESEEAAHFYTINSKAKPVKNDLSLALAKGRKSKGLINEKESNDPRLKGHLVAEELAIRSRFWKKVLHMPNEPTEGTLINNNGLATSLVEPLKKSETFADMEVQEQARLLDAYWGGIKLLYPKAFTKPKDYALQKLVGVFLMHFILADAIEIAEAKELNIYEKETYRKILRPLLCDSKIMKGKESFWLVGKEARHYTSGIARSVFGKKLAKELKRKHRK